MSDAGVADTLRPSAGRLCVRLAQLIDRQQSRHFVAMQTHDDAHKGKPWISLPAVSYMAADLLPIHECWLIGGG